MDFNGVMNKVLSQRKYDKLTGRLFDWRAWLREHILDLIQRILSNFHIDFSSLFQPGSSGWINNWIKVLSILGVILLVFIAVRLIIVLRKRFKKRNGKAGGIFEGIDKNNSTAAGLLEAGAGLAANGYFRDAVRYCLASVLLALDRKKIYRLNYSKTNGQILRELRGKMPSIVPALTVLVEVFNAVWFGHRNISIAQFNRYWHESSSLVTEVEAYQ